jgi:hypothetical protein
MTKTEHIQFLALLIPTFLILAAAAVSMADLASPVPEAYAAVAAADPIMPAAAVWDERPAQ